jgi:hypothetical protein
VLGFIEEAIMIWKFIKDKVILDRIHDEEVHAAAMNEIKSGRRRDGLWTKAIIEASGSEEHAKISYMRLLVVAIRDDAYIAQRQRDFDREREIDQVTTRGASPAKPAQPLTVARVLTRDELMEKFGISQDGPIYCYMSYRYEKLEDAVAYAQIDQKRKQ